MDTQTFFDAKIITIRLDTHLHLVSEPLPSFTAEIMDLHNIERHFKEGP